MTSQKFIHFSVLTALVLAAFSNIFQNGFIMDDYDFIVQWPLIQSWGNLYRFFVDYIPPDGQPGIYSPLKTLFHAVTFRLFGADPFGYHAVSLLIHLTSIFFVYRIVEFLSRSSLTAFLSSLLFALHPVQVEAITYLTASIDMIGIMFLFVAFDFFIRKKQRQAMVFSALAIFTHELAISLPLLFGWYEICLGESRGKWKAAWKKVWPFFVIMLVYVSVKLLVLGSVTRGGYIFGNLYLTLLVTIKAMVQYIWICLWPAHLTVNHIIADGIYSYGISDFDRYAVLAQSIFDLQTAASVIVLVIVFAVLWRMFTLQPLVAFCLGWFFLSLAPVSNIIPSSIYFGERYLYPGLLGFVLLAGMGFTRLYEYRRGLTWAMVVILAAGYGGRTYLRNADWKDQVTFYESGVKGNPQSAYMRRDLGIVYLENRWLPEALDTLKQAVTLSPHDPDLYLAVAEAYKELQQYPQAESFLKEALRLKADFAEAHFNLAGLYAAQGQILAAKQHMSRAFDAYKNSGRFLESYEAWTAFHQYFQLK